MLEDTQSSLTPHLLHGQVQEDEGSSPPHPGTAVDQEGCGQRGGVLLADTTDERDEGHGVVRYSMVRPGCVEHVGHCQLLLWLLQLRGEKANLTNIIQIHYLSRRKPQYGCPQHCMKTGDVH